jgi:molybdopterin-guanine dinucleotide biosynthesis protein A
MKIEEPRPAAIILCGGKSRRMGRPKAWLPFGPERMLTRVARRVAGAAGSVVIVAAPGQDLPPVYGVSMVVRDPVSDRGPMQGLAAGLGSLPESVELAFATATDVPLVLPDWISRLAELIDDHDLAIPFVAGFHHPLAALYRRATVLPGIEALLKAGQLRPVRLMEVVKTRVVTDEELRAVDPELDTLRNLNTPEDYLQALERAGLPSRRLDAPRNVRIEFFGVPRLRAGVGQIEVRASTIGEALQATALSLPALEGEVIVGNRPGPSCRLSWNGERFVNDPDVPLDDGDSLVLLSADVGG